jgi:hypothetical protein
MLFEEMFAMVFIVGIFAGVFIIYLGLRQRSLQLEMFHRERMAMIDKGMIPLADPEALHVRRVPHDEASSKSLSLGIIVIGLGLAIATIITFAGGAPESGVGVGGAIAIIGGAFVVRSILVRPQVGTGQSSTPASSTPVVRLPGDDRIDRA